MAAIVVMRSRTVAALRPWRVGRRFGSGFWTFFAAAFFFDLGFGLFFFLFNLYLTDLHFNERIIGNITASLTLGNVVATIPASLLARRLGLRPLLLFSFVCTPLICVFRLYMLWEPAQIALSFATGMALCCWPICFSPAVASLTPERHRTSGFSIMFATGIGVGSFAGVLGGYIPELLHTANSRVPLVGAIRMVLLLACGIVILGAIPLWKLRLGDRLPKSGSPMRFHPFLLRFLPPFLLWNVVTGSFPAFGAIYLQQILHIPLARLGFVFSASQLAQFAAVLASPLLFRRWGLAGGVGLAQLCTAALLVLLGASQTTSPAVACFLAYNAMLFMCGPGIYNLLMNRIPEEERSTASALQNLCGAICQAATQAITGLCIVEFGYRTILLTNAAFAVTASLLFFSIREPSAQLGRKVTPVDQSRLRAEPSRTIQ
jgi:MFS family permease